MHADRAASRLAPADHNHGGLAQILLTRKAQQQAGKQGPRRDPLDRSSDLHLTQRSTN